MKVVERSYYTFVFIFVVTSFLLFLYVVLWMDLRKKELNSIIYKSLFFIIFFINCVVYK